MKFPSAVSSFLFTLAALGLCLPHHAAAQTTWVGGGTDSNWTTAANWSGGIAPVSGTGAWIQLDGTTALNPVVNFNSPWILNRLDFNPNAAAFSLSGNPLSFQGSAPQINNSSINSQAMINNNILFSGTALTVSGGNLSLTLAGQISGTGAVIVNRGSVAFSGSNSYNGVTIQTGSLTVTNDHALGSGTTTIGSQGIMTLSGGITISGQTLSMNNTSNFYSLFSGAGDNAWTGNIDYVTSAVINASTAGATLTLSGSLQGHGNGGAAGGDGNVKISGPINNFSSFEKYGSGTLTLSGNNSSINLFTISGGTLILQGTNAANGTNLSLGIGTIQLQADQKIGSLSDNGSLSPGVLQLGSQNITVNQISNNLFSSVITGAGSLVKTGGARLSLQGANTYTGTTIITAGTLSANSLAVEGAGGGVASSIGASGNAASNLVLDGGTLQFSGSGSGTTDRLFVVTANGGALNASGSNAALVFTNTGSVVFSGTGARLFTLTGTNTGANTFFTAITDGTGGVASLAKSGTGTWILAGTNSYTGSTSINAGILQLAQRVSLYNGGTSAWTAANISVASGGTLALNVGGAGEFTSSDIDILKALGSNSRGFLAGSTLGIDTTNASGGVFTYASDIANPNSGANALNLAKAGPGTLVLSGSNTYTGTTTVAGGVLQIDANSRLGNGGALVINGGGLQYSAAFNDLRSFTLGTSGATLDTNGFDVTYNGTLSGGGALTKIGAGTLTYTGKGTGYTGTARIKSGTLAVSGQSSFGTTNVTLSIGDTAGDNGGLTVSGSGTVSANSSTFGNAAGSTGAGVVSGGTFTSGSLVIGNSGTGSVYVNGGALKAGSAIIIAQAAQSSGTLTMDSGSITTNAISMATTGTVGAGGVGTLTLNGGTLSGGLITIGNGTMVINGGTYHSSIFGVNGKNGVLNINGGAGDGTLQILASATVNMTSGTFSGGLDVARSGAGVFNFSGGTYTSSSSSPNYIGHVNIVSSSGTLNMSGGNMSLSGTLYTGYAGPGVLNLSGGTLATANVVMGESTDTTFFGNGTAAVTGGTWTNSGALVVGDLSSGALNVSSGSLSTGTLSVASGTGSGATGVVSITGSGNLTVNSAMNVASGLNSSGTLNISGSGSLLVSSGTGKISIASGVGSSGALNISNNGSLTIGTLTIGAGGAVNLSSGGTLNAGSMSITSGSIRLGDNSGFNLGGLSGGASATLTLDYSGTSTLTTALGGFQTITKTGTSTLVLANNVSTTGTLTISAGTLQSGTGGANTFTTGGIVDNGTLILNQSGLVTLTTISGTGSLVAAGKTVRITGTTAYTGGTTIKSGTVTTIGNIGFIDHIGANLVIGDTSGDNGVLSFGGNINDLDGIIGNGVGSSGTATYTSKTWNNARALYVGKSGTGTLNLSSGTINVGSGTGTVTIAQDAGSAGTINYSGGALNAAVITGGSGNAVMNIIATGTYAQQFTGSLNLVKTGAGVAVFTGSNTYSGTTQVNGGVMRVNGTASNSTTVINTSGTLGGTGSLSSVTVASGGTLMPGSGSAPGKLSTAGEAWLGGGKFVMAINSFTGTAGADPGWSSVDINGALNLTYSTSANPFTLKLNTLTLADVAGAAANFSNGTAYRLTIASTTAGITGFDPAAFAIDTSSVANAFTGTFSVTQSGNNLQLAYNPTYNDWASGFSLSGSNAAATTDYDGDGMSNLMEFALGTDPTVPDAKNALPQASVSTISAQSYATLSYQRPSGGALGVTYIVEENSDLNNTAGWSNANVVQDSITLGTGGLETVVMRYTTAIGNGGAFLRLRVTQP